MTSASAFLQRIWLAFIVAAPGLIPFLLGCGYYRWGCNAHSKSIATPDLRAQLKEIVEQQLAVAASRDKATASPQQKWSVTGGELPMHFAPEGLMASDWGAPRVNVDATANDGITRITVDWGGSKTGHHGFVLAPTQPEQGGGYGAGIMTGDDGKDIVFEGHMTFTHWVDDCYLMFDPD